MKSIKKYLKYSDPAVAALALVSFIMLLLPAISYGEESINGFQAIFGYSESAFGHSVKIFGFSFFNFLTFLLTLGVIGCSVFAFIKKNELLSLVSAGIALLSGIFFFLMNAAAQPEGLADYLDTSLSVGPILAGIFLILAAGVGVAKKVLDK